MDVITIIPLGMESDLSDTDYQAAFGRRLRLARQQAGYKSARAFAKKLGIHEGRYREYERGNRSPSFQLLERIANLTHRSLDYFIRALD